MGPADVRSTFRQRVTWAKGPIQPSQTRRLARQTDGRTTGLLLLLLVVCGCRPTTNDRRDAVNPIVDAQCPPLTAEGWLNGPPPTPDSLRGKLTVIDCWGHWCEPCRVSAPRLVQLYNEMNDRDVVFIGLTADGLTAINDIRAHVVQLKIPWPNGYGAGATITALGVQSLPTRLLIGRNGRIVWRGSDVQGLREALGAQP